MPQQMCIIIIYLRLINIAHHVVDIKLANGIEHVKELVIKAIKPASTLNNESKQAYINANKRE